MKQRLGKGTYRALTLVGMVFTIICGLFIFWMVRPYDYITATNPTILNSKYYPGGPAFIQYDKFCINKSIGITVQRISIDLDTGRELYFNPYGYTAEHVPVGCYDDLVVEYPLPAELVPNHTYRIKIEISYHPNPITTETETFETTNTMTILEPGKGNTLLPGPN